MATTAKGKTTTKAASTASTKKATTKKPPTYRFQNVDEVAAVIAERAKAEGLEPKAIDLAVIKRLGTPLVKELRTRVSPFPNQAFVRDVRRKLKQAK